MNDETPPANWPVPEAALTGETQSAIPLICEELEIGRREIDTGRGVRLKRSVREREETVDPPLARDELEVRRVPIGRLVEGEPGGIREEGDVVIVPVYEEVLVVTRRWRLKEELRIRRGSREFHQPQTVVLRSEHVEVESFDEKSPEAPAD